MALVALAALGCGSDEPSVGEDAGGSFVAYQSDFQTFHSWTSFTFEGVAIPDSPHATAGVRTEYINTLPPKGATKFPLGTIIVKEFPATGQTFAMVKVGGGYNPDGAIDWEWYELQNNTDGSVKILWGDPDAPPGDPYASSPQTCNGCHSNAVGNDYVQSRALNLARLASGAPFDGGVIADDDAGASPASDASLDGASE